MTHWMSRRRWVVTQFCAVVAVAVSGCGTLLYPERRGQPAGRLDWKVVALNGIGLLFFFIPGVIAFAVDFLNGTIYLPAESEPCEPPCLPAPASAAKSTNRRLSGLRPIKVPRKELTPRRIEEVIARYTGKEISLDNDDYRTMEMESIDEFWELREQVERSASVT